MHIGDEVDETRHLNEKWMIVQWHFKTFPRCARLGAMLRKMSISNEAKYVHMVGNISAYMNIFRAARSWGRCWDIQSEYFGGRSWWKDWFSKDNITCALIFRTKFLGAILAKRSIFKVYCFSSSSPKIFYLLGLLSRKNLVSMQRELGRRSQIIEHHHETKRVWNEWWIMTDLFGFERFRTFQGIFAEVGNKFCKSSYCFSFSWDIHEIPTNFH